MTVIHREAAQHPALRVEDRLRPAGAQPMTQCQFLKRLPKRVGGNVADDDPSPVESSRAARTHFGSDGYAVNGSIVFGWQVGPRAVPEVQSIQVQHEHGGDGARRLLLDHLDDRFECLHQGGAGSELFQHPDLAVSKICEPRLDVIHLRCAYAGGKSCWVGTHGVVRWKLSGRRIEKGAQTVGRSRIRSG